MDVFEEADELRRQSIARYAKLRRETLRKGGARHSVDEVAEIVQLQENRCFYCNLLFDGTRGQATKDHLLPVTSGGTDWALNIVIACRRCNARRGNIPFRTYCTLLSPRQ
ncbi:MAG: HNH endonuclease, partial [Acidobacteriota bacterium]